MSKTKTVKKLDLTITYKVGYGDVKMPKKIYEQLLKAAKNGDEIEMNKYPDVADWMSSNVREIDCMNWKAEIDDLRTFGAKESAE
jgi:hypothetical protein